MTDQEKEQLIETVRKVASRNPEAFPTVQMKKSDLRVLVDHITDLHDSHNAIAEDKFRLEAALRGMLELWQNVGGDQENYNVLRANEALGEE